MLTATNFLVCHSLILEFSAFVGSVTIANAPGTIADIFDENSRNLAITIFYLAPMNGPVLGPVIGGFVYGGLGWRWTNWMVLILSGVLAALTFLVPETYAPVLMRKKADKLRKDTGDGRYRSKFCYKDGEGDFWTLIKTNLERPLVMLFTEPLWYVDGFYSIIYHLADEKMRWIAFFGHFMSQSSMALFIYASQPTQLFFHKFAVGVRKPQAWPSVESALVRYSPVFSARSIRKSTKCIRSTRILERDPLKHASPVYALQQFSVLPQPFGLHGLVHRPLFTGFGRFSAASYTDLGTR